MIVNDKIYEFEIYYYAGRKAERKKIVFSDSDDIYKLEGVPETTTKIYCRSTAGHDKEWELQSTYMVGEELTKEEARKEIETLQQLKVSYKLYDFKERMIKVLEKYCSDPDESNKIYINRSVDYCDPVVRRIILSPLWLGKETIIFPKQIACGKIFPLEKADESRPFEKEDESRPYLDLE